MNILLIHPYINSSVPRLYLNEPLGLVCLATYLENQAKTKRKIDILDLYVRGHNNVVKDGEYYNIGICEPQIILGMVKRYNPDIIGISCNFTTYTKAVFEIVDLLKDNFPDALIVLGGAHATMDAENILSRHRKVDVVVRGEGEITFNELIESIEVSKGYDNIPGLSYRQNGKVISNPPRPLIPEINNLPIPDRKYIQQDIYADLNKKMYFLSKGNRVASIMTSRGCPFDCRFCSTKVVWERKFRPRNAELVAAEMEELIKNYNIDEFLINDDQFYFDKKRVMEICDLLIEKGFRIKINVASGSSVWLIDETLLKRFKMAGLYRITFPIETGCRKTMKYIRKPIDLKKTKVTIKLANSLGIWTFANFIVGFPYETKEDIQETVNYAYRSGLDFATFFIAKPYAGSEMYEDFKKEGLLVEGDDRPTTMGEVSYSILYLTAEELQGMRDRAQKKMLFHTIINYFNPLFFSKHVFPKINSWDNLKYFVKAILGTLMHLKQI